MTQDTRQHDGTRDDFRPARANGAAMAAFVAAGVGAFAVACFVILNELGLFAAPSLYAPAGGVSGRTTFATLTWLIAWAFLHWRWNGERVAEGRVRPITLILVLIGIVGTLPPVWTVLGA